MKSMKFFFTLAAILTMNQSSLADYEAAKIDRKFECRQAYDDQNIYLSGVLTFSNDSDQYEVRPEQVGFSSTENFKYDGDSTATTTDPSSGKLNFETQGTFAAKFKLTSLHSSNYFSGDATYVSNNQTFSVRCTYEGEQLPTQK